MKRILPWTLAALALGVAVGRLGAADDAKASTVAAKRYRIAWADSALELTHGGGEWVDELFLPDAKLVAGVRFEAAPYPEGWKPGDAVPARRARIYAHASDKPRNDLTGFHDPKPSTIDDVAIPADLARRIRDLAALQMRLDDESVALGKDLADALKLAPLPSLSDSPTPPK
jgi:hypothetical protein